MTARHNWIAVGPRGVYALLDAQLATVGEVAAFWAKAKSSGHAVELVPVGEACRRHHDYLMQFADMRAADAKLRLAAIVPPAFLPSPDQLEMFAPRTAPAGDR